VAVRVSARGEHEHRAAARSVELGLVDRNLVLDEPAKHDQELARARVELRPLELLEPSPGPGSHQSRPRSSRASAGTSGTGRCRVATPSLRCSAGRSPSSLREYVLDPTEAEHLLEAELAER